MDEGIALAESVEKISADLSLTRESKSELVSLCKEGVLLFFEYMEWVRGRFAPYEMSHSPNVKRGKCAESFEMVFIDGQTPVSVVEVTLSKKPFVVPESAIDYGDELGPALKTKWENFSYIRALQKGV